jgi:hypothetical protein
LSELLLGFVKCGPMTGVKADHLTNL